MRYLLLHGYVEHGQTNSIIHNICRGEDGNRYDIVIDDFIPYFYSETGNIDDDIKNYHVSKASIPSFEGKDMFKITTQFTYDIEGLRKKFMPHYEADILFQLRLRYDTGIKYYFECDPDNTSYKNLIPVDEELNIKPKVYCVDIENMDEIWTDADVADNPIVSIAVKNETSGKYIIFVHTEYDIDNNKISSIFDTYFDDKIEYKICQYRTEKLMLEGFGKMLKDTKPDILYGWNFNDYDATYIETRCKTVGVYIDFRQFQTFDDMAGYKKLSENDLPSVALDEIAKAELKQQKIPRDKIHKMIVDDVEKLIAYNFGDVYLTSKIDKKRNIIGFHSMLAKVSGTELVRTPHNSFIADSFYLHLSNGKMILPSCNTRVVPVIDKGAIVQDPSSGIIEWVASFDLSKAYPTAMIENNLSPDTLLPGPSDTIPYIQMPSGRCYRTDKDGIVKIAAQTLIDERAKYQRLENEYLEANNIEMYKIHKEAEIAIKKITNSLYGSLGQVHKKRGTNTFRLAHGGVASDVTRAIREVITWIDNRIADLKSLEKYAKTDNEKEMLELLYPYQDVMDMVGGDTDSILFHVPFAELLQDTGDKEQSINILKNLETLLTRSTEDYSLESSGKNGIYNIEFEKLYCKFFQAGVKKRYVGVYEWRKGVWMKDKPIQERIEVRGYEVRRSDWSLMCKAFMNKLLEVIFIDNATEKEVGRMLRNWKTDFYNGEYDVLMKWPKRASAWTMKGDLNKNGRQKSKTTQQRAIEISNEYISRNYHKGDKPWMCYIKKIKNGPVVDVIALDIDDDPNDYADIDYDTMWEKQAQEPIRRIIEGLGWNYFDIEQGMVTKDMEEFF